MQRRRHGFRRTLIRPCGAPSPDGRRDRQGRMVFRELRDVLTDACGDAIYHDEDAM
jgi:hypothetical protein